MKKLHTHPSYDTRSDRGVAARDREAIRELRAEGLRLAGYVRATRRPPYATADDHEERIERLSKILHCLRSWAQTYDLAQRALDEVEVAS